jgi:hypothetical protein
MGQYYKPIILNETKDRPVSFVYSHDFDNGLKLMEHSWIGNNFVGFVENLLFRNPQPIVWAGDYADNETKLSKDVLKSLLAEDDDKRYQESIKTDGANMYSIASTLDVKLPPTGEKLNLNQFKYVVNHDKKQFVDKTKVPKITAQWVGDADYRIHPLPLLTCEGNNGSGGDFRGNERNLVGVWSRDVISIESRKSDIPNGFTELTFDLIEE